MNPLALLKAAPWVLLGLAVTWAVLERNGRKDALIANEAQKNQSLSDANQAWSRVGKAQEEFDEQVAKGLAALTQKQRDMESTVEDYRKAVASDPGGRVLLTPAELAALRLLTAPRRDQAGRGAVRSPNASAPVQ